MKNLLLLTIVSIGVVASAEIKILHALTDSHHQQQPHLTARGSIDTDTLALLTNKQSFEDLKKHTIQDGTQYHVQFIDVETDRKWTRQMNVPSGEWASDFITLHMHAGNLQNIDYQIKSSDKASTSHINEPRDTKVRVSEGVQGAQPKLELKHGDSATVMDLKPQVEQTFFQKYWMYLLIGGLFMLLSGGGGGGPEEAKAVAKK